MNILQVRMKRMKTVLTSRSRSLPYISDEDVSFFNIKLVNNHQAAGTITNEPMILRTTSTDGKPELPVVTHITS